VNPDEIVGTPRESEIYLSPDWSKRGATAAAVGPGATKVSIRTVTYRNGRIVTYVLDENHQPITHQALSESVDPDVKAAWDRAQTTSQRGDQEGDVRGNEATNPNREVFHTGRGWVVEPNPVYQPPAKDAATNATETHYEDANGNRVPTPTAPGASARKPVPGKPGVYEVTIANPTTGVTETHYEDDSGNRVPTPTEPPKSNRKPVPNRPGIYEVTNANPTTGVTETHYEDESGARVATPSEAAPTTSMSRPAGPVGPVTTWLQTETEKLAKQAAEENWTRERFDAEVKRRLDFAHQLVAENTATQAQENATADRVAANQRQAMSTSGGIATSIAPGMIKAGGEFLPGNGRVATEGLMAMLGMLGQYTQRASQQAGNAAGRTTISPDGTITVQHVPAGSAPPAQPAQDQADAAVRHAQAAAGVNTLGSAGTDPVFRPAPPTDVQPAAAGPDFTDPTTGQFGIPGSFSTGPYGAVPDWMQQQATQAAAPSGGDANEYLGMVGQDDPSWQAALAEANRRRSMSMAGAA
jgi:hypothetical protein